MTDYIFSNPWLVIFFIGGPIFLAFVFIVNSIHISRHLSVMLKALENSSQITLYSMIYKSMGVFGKICLVTQIAGMLIWPKLEMRAGVLDACDVANFPPHLLRLLKVNMAFLLVSIVWFIGVCIVLKLR